MPSKLMQARMRFDDFARQHGGCSDGYCVFKLERGGMHTNGGCRCAHGLDRVNAQRLASIARQLRDAASSEEGK